MIHNNLLDLLSLRYFVRVIETASFSACAREFGVAPSSVTRAIQSLEQSLGVPLLYRTTRRVLPSDAGRAFYVRARRIALEIDEASQEAAGLGNEVRGVLRISAPVGFGQLRLGSLLPEFLARHPNLQIELNLTDAYVDLLQDSIDIAIRMGIDKDSSLKAKRLGSFKRVACAAPSYLKARGEPRSIEELASHSCLTFDYGPESRYWYFKQSSHAPQEVSVRGSVHVNCVQTLLNAACAGLGICLLPSWIVEEELRQGRLVSVLASVQANLSPVFNESIYALYLGQKPAPKVKAFVDFLVEKLRRQ